MKQIVRVLEAVQSGCQTSHDCAEETGLTVKTCSAYLSALASDGLIRRFSSSRMSSRGRETFWYEPAKS